MKINKESQQIEKWEISILMNAEDYFLMLPPYEKDQKNEKCEKLIVMDIQNIFSVRPRFT